MGNSGLVAIAVAALVVGMVADMVNVETIDEAIGAIINGQTQKAHVVGVHYTVAKTHGLPLGHHARCACHYYT